MSIVNDMAHRDLLFVLFLFLEDVMRTLDELLCIFEHLEIGYISDNIPQHRRHLPQHQQDRNSPQEFHLSKIIKKYDVH